MRDGERGRGEGARVWVGRLPWSSLEGVESFGSATVHGEKPNQATYLVVAVRDMVLERILEEMVGWAETTNSSFGLELRSLRSLLYPPHSPHNMASSDTQSSALALIAHGSEETEFTTVYDLLSVSSRRLLTSSRPLTPASLPLQHPSRSQGGHRISRPAGGREVCKMLSGSQVMP